MRVMVIVKANEEIEGGARPSTQDLAEMGEYNEELAKAGVMVAAEGLLPSSKGKRVRFGEDGPTVTDGPFANAGELVAGFWIWKVASMDEAVDWLKRAPFGAGGVDKGRPAEIEIRTLAEAEDFGSEFTPELREQEDRVRALGQQNQAAS